MIYCDLGAMKRTVSMHRQLFFLCAIITTVASVDFNAPGDSESDIDLLVPLKSLLNERAEIYKAKGLEGFPAVGIKRGIEIVVPYRQYLPRKFFRNFAFTAVIRPDDRQGGYLFAVVNPLDTVVDLGVALESAGGNQVNITLFYTDSSKETDSKALASFLVPEFTGHWAKFALEVQDDNIVLYFRCTRFATRQVKRRPLQLVMDDAHKLYIASAGPILKGGFEVIRLRVEHVHAQALKSTCDRIVLRPDSSNRLDFTREQNSLRGFEESLFISQPSTDHPDQNLEGG